VPDDLAAEVLAEAELANKHIIMLRDEAYTWMQMLVSYHELSFWAKHREVCMALALLCAPLVFVLFAISDKLPGGFLWFGYVLLIFAFLLYKGRGGTNEFQKWREGRVVVDTSINVFGSRVDDRGAVFKHIEDQLSAGKTLQRRRRFGFLYELWLSVRNRQ
jgi:hypothetical protein